MNNPKFHHTLAAIVCMFTLPLMAQAPSPALGGYTAAPGFTAAMAALKSRQDLDATMRALMDINQHSRAFFYYMVNGQLAADRFQRFVQLIENARMDKQSGSSAGSSGGSSLVSKPSATAVLSAAIETGALTQSLSTGPQTTFRGDTGGSGRIVVVGEARLPRLLVPLPPHPRRHR